MSRTTGEGLGVSGEQISEQTGSESAEIVDKELVKFFDGKFAQAIENIPEELRLLPEEELYDRVCPLPTDWKMRQHLSNLVKEARATGREHIPTTRVYEGIIARQNFHVTIMPNPLKMAWLTRPLVEHTDYYNAIHKLTLDKLFRMVRDMPLDPKYLPQLLKIAETAGNRVHGPVVQKMHIQSKNLNIEANARDLPGGADDPSEMQKQIESLQAKLIEAPKDVTPSEE